MNKLRINSRVFLIIALLIVLATGGVFAYRRFATVTPAKDPSINYGPPTVEEQRAGDEQKEKIVEEDKKQPSPTPQSPTKAEVVIVDASQYGGEIEIRAYVSNIYADGTCTATFTKGTQKVEKEGDAFKEATNTQCKTITIPRSEFPSAGTWNVTVAFSSASSSGEATGTIQVK
jgi:hypothetical protein